MSERSFDEVNYSIRLLHRSFGSLDPLELRHPGVFLISQRRA